MALPSLGRNAAWALAGNLVYAACQAGVLVALAKLTSAADVGRFALGLAVASPVVLFTNLHLRAVQATDARRAHAFGTYLGLRLLTVAAALAVVAALALGGGYDRATALVILAVGLAKGVEAVSDVLLGRLQQAERLRRIALSLMAKGACGLAAVAVVVAATGSVFAAVLALAAGWAVVLLAADLRAVGGLEPLCPRFDPRALGGLARLALPLGGVMGLNALMVSVPRFAVADALGPAALGHFAALAYLLVAAQQPMLALGAAVSPRLARHFVADRDAYARLARVTVALALVLGLGLVAAAALVGPRLLPLVYTPEYARHAGVLTWLALAGAVGMGASALGYSLTAARWFGPQLAVAAAAVSVCALASHWLVPRWGLTGAAWAVIATEGCRVVCLGVLHRAARTAPVPAAALAGAR